MLDKFTLCMAEIDSIHLENGQSSSSVRTLATRAALDHHRQIHPGRGGSRNDRPVYVRDTERLEGHHHV